MPTEEEIANHLKNWARQTVVFTIMLREDVEWKSLNEEEQARRAAIETQRICPQHWQQAQRECDGNWGGFPKVYSGIVLRWAAEQLLPK